MISNLKNIYHEKYDNIDTNELVSDDQNIDNNNDIPTGWSLLCLNETINYYTEYLNKESN
uniref:Uncharacterized protein n=1 Tax=Dipterosiphonia australica TaxID=2007208 RepID=A0A1Z1ML74_9FLOR|nr:hypothetical protein [Dipterosiphonia australica]ARW66808.1 hypothetical protein [Dipterosiphonia australica]